LIVSETSPTSVDDFIGGFHGVGVVDHNFGTAAGELNSHSSTDTATGARHESDLAIEAG
jgi:hypothetical protein